MEDLFVDVGARSATEVLDWGIRPGTPLCPDVQAKHTHNPNRLIGKAFDDRAGCAVCIETALRTRDAVANTSFIGSVQEEAGLRGATVIGNDADSVDLAIVLEGTPADDAPGMRSTTSQGVLGNGVQIRCFDPTHIANSRLVDWVISVAQQHNIPHQLAVRRSGGTNAGKYHLAGHGIPTTVLGVPARYIHSHQSMIDLHDYQATVALTEALIRSLTNEVYQNLLPV
jgi:putative aminopeptidase FrvX